MRFGEKEICVRQINIKHDFITANIFSFFVNVIDIL